MKKLYWFIGIAMMALAVVACKKTTEEEQKPEDKPDINNIVEDGFYVTGEATGLDKTTNLLAMAKGHNEAKNNELRDGMYEKYIVLQGGKEFTLAYVNGGKQEAYGAELTEFKPEALTGIYDNNPADQVFKGKLVVGDNAPKMKVSATGLYHIVLDLNLAKDLTDAQILVSPVTWGVRGGMNGWGFTALEATAASNDGITYTLSGQKLAEGGEFKFAYNGAWKITLDNEGAVKANTNLGKDCEPGGANIPVTEGAGLYKITLTYKLAAGELANSFKYEIAQESAISAPTTMYMIGDQFGNWNWESDEVVELVPVWGTTGCFWATRYFKAGNGFKFCGERAWNGDFGKFADDGSIIGDNNTVESDGFYTVYVDYVGKSVVIAPAEVWGIGACWKGLDCWNYNTPDAVLFEADGDKLFATVTNGNEVVRIASKVVPTKEGTEGITGDGWFDWWKTEFIFYDGVIAYRGLGGDQEAVKVEAGKKIILDLNAGTVEVVDGGELPPIEEGIKIDGDPSDWEGVENVVSLTCPPLATLTALQAAKILYSDKLYIMVQLSDAALADGKVRLHVYFDTDETGGVTQHWNEANIDYMTEGKLTNSGAYVPYTSSFYKWDGTPDNPWKWADTGAALGFEGAGDNNIYELAIDYTNYPGGLPEQFNIGLDVVDSGWSVFGYLPQTYYKLVIKKDGLAEQPEEPEIPVEEDGIVLDGNFDDWAEIEGATNDNNTIKVTADEEYVYIYSHRAPTGRYGEIWNGGGYIYVGFDLDGDASTGEMLNDRGPFEFVFFISPYGGSAEAPAIADDFKTLGYGASCKPAEYTVENIVGAGAVTEEGAFIEFRIPRADMPAIPATPINVYSNGNKDMATVYVNVTL